MTCSGTEEKPHGGIEMIAGEDADEERLLAGGEKAVQPGGCSCPRCRNIRVVRTYQCLRCGATEEVNVTPSCE